MQLPPPPPGHWRRDDGASSLGPAPEPQPAVVEPPYEFSVVIPKDEAPKLRLSELDPRWIVLEDGGPRVGLTFECPHCHDIRLAVLFHESGKAALEDPYIRAHHPNDPDLFIWDLCGQEDFETLSLFPSVDASRSGHWHGFITDGNVV